MSAGRSIVASGLALLLTGCAGGLLGGGAPAQLYRLEAANGSATPGAAPLESRTKLVLLPVRFAPGIEGDRILTVKGQRAQYLKGARWLTDSPELFGTALRAHFERQVPALLLTGPRDPAGAKLLLKLAVERFEAVYPPAPEEAAPVVRIEGEARLYRVGDGGLVAVQRFVCEVPARGNRLGPIVDAFAEATRAFAERLAIWAQAEVTVPR